MFLYINNLSLGQGRREKKWNQLLENKKATDAPASFFFFIKTIAIYRRVFPTSEPTLGQF